MNAYQHPDKVLVTSTGREIDLGVETIVVGIGLPIPEVLRNSPIEGRGLNQLKTDLGELRGVLDQIGSPAAGNEYAQRFSDAHERLTGRLESITADVDTLAGEIRATPPVAVISLADNARHINTLRTLGRESRRVINAASSALGELTEITEAGRVIGLSESMVAMIRTVANVAKERIVSTMRGVRNEVREGLADARRYERELPSSGVKLSLVDIAPGAFQITTPFYGVPAAAGSEQTTNQRESGAARLELRRELDELIVANVAAQASKAANLALRAMGFLSRLDAVCETGIVRAIVSGRFLDAVPFMGNRRIERRIADDSAALARCAKREKELMAMIGGSAVLSA